MACSRSARNFARVMGGGVVVMASSFVGAGDSRNCPHGLLQECALCLGKQAARCRLRFRGTLLTLPVEKQPLFLQFRLRHLRLDFNLSRQELHGQWSRLWYGFLRCLECDGLWRWYGFPGWCPRAGLRWGRGEGDGHKDRADTGPGFLEGVGGEVVPLGVVLRQQDTEGGCLFGGMKQRAGGHDSHQTATRAQEGERVGAVSILITERRIG